MNLASFYKFIELFEQRFEELSQELKSSETIDEYRIIDCSNGKSKIMLFLIMTLQYMLLILRYIKISFSFVITS